MASPQLAPAPLTLSDGRNAIAAWPLDPSVLHINHGSFGAVPTAVLEEQAEYKRQMEAAPVRWFPELPERIAQTRERLAPFIGVPASHLALVPNASGGASVVYNSIQLHPGDEVIVTDHGYGAVTMGAERLASRYGATVTTVHVDLAASSDDARDAVLDALTPRTALIVVDQITSPTARLLPVAEITAGAHAQGVRVLVDGAHVPGLYDDAVASLGCDYWIGNLHKFACAPRGAAVLVAAPTIADSLYPLIDSWGARDPYPQRFDMQGTLDQTSYLAAPASLAFIEREWGWAEARRYMTELASYGQARIAAAFAERTGLDHIPVVGEPANALRLIVLPSGLAPDHDSADALRDRIMATCGAEAAFTSFDGVGYLRISAHVYNTAHDFDEFAERCVPVLCEWAQQTA